MFKQILLASIITAAGQASEPWSTKDKIMEGTFLVSLAMDWDQTSQIHKHGNMKEINSILGTHPEQSTINQYFLASALIHVAVADQLHGRWRTAWQATWIGLEIGTVQRNYKLGIRFNF